MPFFEFLDEIYNKMRKLFFKKVMTIIGIELKICCFGVWGVVSGSVYILCIILGYIRAWKIHILILNAILIFITIDILYQLHLEVFIGRICISSTLNNSFANRSQKYAYLYSANNVPAFVKAA